MTCITCGTVEIVGKDSNQRFCAVCRVGERICPHCKTLFTPNPRAKRSIFCSTECSQQSRHLKYAKPMKHGYGLGTGHTPDDWKMLSIAKDVCYGTHPRACWICGTNNDPWRIHVHHIDEIRSHNTIDNLIPLCDPCHRIVHIYLRRMKEHPNSTAMIKLAEVVNLNLLKTGNPNPVGPEGNPVLPVAGSASTNQVSLADMLK